MKVKVGISNRHIHLKQADCDILFGKGFELENFADLKQIGQFAAKQVLTLKTNKGTIENVRIIGPVRNYSQVEISRTDAYKLGLNPPIRDAGDLNESEKITLVGPCGEVEIVGCIIARRHIHITKEDKEKYNLPDTVKVEYDGVRGGVFDNVFVKVSDASYFELHIDTDEANAFDLKNDDELKIIE